MLLRERVSKLNDIEMICFVSCEYFQSCLHTALKYNQAGSANQLCLVVNSESLLAGENAKKLWDEF